MVDAFNYSSFTSSFTEHDGEACSQGEPDPASLELRPLGARSPLDQDRLLAQSTAHKGAANQSK